LRGQAWLLLTIPLGFTTWAAFLYIGIRARRAQWLAWAGVYAATLAAYVALDTPSHPGSTAQGVAAGLALLTWIGGGIHALAISNDAVRRIQGRTDPAVEARMQTGGFSSVEDLGLLLDLPPSTVDQMRDTAIFMPG
jgi:hypothetical protein